MDFGEFNIPGNDSYYDILEEKHETISLNNIAWVKVWDKIWKGKVMKIPFSDRKEDSKYLKIKWLDTRMEEKVLTSYISLDY